MKWKQTPYEGIFRYRINVKLLMILDNTNVFFVVIVLYQKLVGSPYPMNHQQQDQEVNADDH